MVLKSLQGSGEPRSTGDYSGLCFDTTVDWKERKEKSSQGLVSTAAAQGFKERLKKKKSHDCDPSESKSVRNALLISMDYFFVKMPNRGVCLYSCYFQQKFYQASFRFFFFFLFTD